MQNGKRRNAFTLTELLVVIAITGILFSLLLGAVQASRAAVRRIECASSMRSLGLASQMFHDANGKLPSGTMLGDSIQPYRSWLSALLPFLEQQALADEIVESYRNWPDPFRPQFHPRAAKYQPLFVCPSDMRNQQPEYVLRYGQWKGMTSYLGIAGRNGLSADGMFYGGSAVRFRDVYDGLSNTLLCGERPASLSRDLGWWYAGTGWHHGVVEHTLGADEIVNSYFIDCSAAKSGLRPVSHPETECDAKHFWSFHPGGAQFQRCDGSNAFLSYSTDRALFLQLSTRGE